MLISRIVWDERVESKPPAEIPEDLRRDLRRQVRPTAALRASHRITKNFMRFVKVRQVGFEMGTLWPSAEILDENRSGRLQTVSNQVPHPYFLHSVSLPEVYRGNDQSSIGIRRTY